MHGVDSDTQLSFNEPQSRESTSRPPMESSVFDSDIHDRLNSQHVPDINSDPSGILQSDTAPSCNRRKRMRPSISSRSLAPTKFVHLDATADRTDSIGCFYDVEPEVLKTTTVNESRETDSVGSYMGSLEPAELLGFRQMEPTLRRIVYKYVRCESAVRCLELAGFNTVPVLSCLDEQQIQRVESFVAHVCSLIPTTSRRECFVGPIFARHPQQFRLPTGVVCGLLLAANEIQNKYRKMHSIVDDSSADLDSTGMCFEENIDAACQTDSSNEYYNSLSIVTSANAQPTVDGLTGSSMITALVASSMHEQAPSSVTSSDSNSISVSDLPKIATSCGSMNNNTGLSTTNTVVAMAAAFQAAAVAATTNVYPGNVSGLENPMFNASPLTCSVDQSIVRPVTTSNSELNFPFNCSNANDSTILNNSSMKSVETAARIAAAVSACTVPNPASFNPLFDEEVIDLERLKQHSSASAIRLAMRQFLNAHLVRGKDFDMEMELSVTPEGFKRVTGIFHCHLCREKRERTSAVRFSVARNRYPVLSNVLSHLKTHFHYRIQTLSSQSNSTGQQVGSGMHSSHTLNDPPMLPYGSNTSTSGLGGLNELNNLHMMSTPISSSSTNIDTINRRASQASSTLDNYRSNSLSLSPSTSIAIKSEALDAHLRSVGNPVNDRGTDELHKRHISSPIDSDGAPVITGCTNLLPPSNLTGSGPVKDSLKAMADFYENQTSNQSKPHALATG